MAPLSVELVEQLKSVGTEWQVKMFDTPCSEPGKFLYGCCCPCCSTLAQRTELLEMTGEPYVCCAGLCPCGPLAEQQDQNCLYCEVCCCLGMAVSGNRWMLQTRYLKQNDPCDDCIICCNGVLACAACILQVAGGDEDLADAVTCASDLMNACVIGCMLSQHQVEIEHIKEQSIEPALGKVLSFLPPKQQEMTALKKV